MTTIMIDNYDSFTWNVVQYLSELGADVRVFRNDAISIAELEALKPKNIVISPGPGYPKDAGISCDVIRHFAGKLPILGVCLGEQCMFEVFGGKVRHAGEIVHGKTSPISHDGKGLFRGVPQEIQVTRYHSLSGDPKTLPVSLDITSRTANDIIMGVRHKNFTVEGVQFHPESIVSQGGKQIFSNFLKWHGGKWNENKDSLVVSDEAVAIEAGHGISQSGQPSVLQKILKQRQVDVALARASPGCGENQLLQYLQMDLAPPVISFYDRLRSASPLTAIMAEFKRASPSKGNINIQANPVEQALAYAYGGASVISVLTEPSWFKGSLQDMRLIRLAMDRVPNRPAVLRKDFIFDNYQILEARLHGADAVLLIVAMLPVDRIRDLIAFSRSMQMEPLVEVNNASELKTAVDIGARVIGVNNRNLHDFSVDMSTTTSMAALLQDRPDIILAALSGISSRADVVLYERSGVGAILVGEALMRASNLKTFMRGLIQNQQK